MKKIITVLLCMCMVSGLYAQKKKANVTPPEPVKQELRSTMDSISYLFGNMVVLEIVYKMDFLKDMISPEAFTAGVRDTFADNVLDIGLDEQFLSDFIEEAYAKHRLEVAAEFGRQLESLMSEEGYALLDEEENIYYKVLNEGTGKNITAPDQVVRLRMRYFYEDDETFYDNDESEQPEEVDASDLLRLFGDKSDILSEGLVFRISWQQTYYGEDPQLVTYEYEILEVLEPIIIDSGDHWE